jgi:hypothetical protein
MHLIARANITPTSKAANSTAGTVKPLGDEGLRAFLAGSESNGGRRSYYPERIAKVFEKCAIPRGPKSYAVYKPAMWEEREIEKAKLEELADNERNAMSSCTRKYIRGDMNGQAYYKALFCGREYCPKCGRNMSIPHRRRIGRLWNRWFQLRTWGYMVFTIAPPLRQYIGRDELGELSKMMAMFLKSIGYDKGFLRWHFAGEDGTTYHPHLNVVIEGQYVDKKDWEQFRQMFLSAWADMIEAVTGLYADGQFHYEYSTSERQACHWLKYIYRATYKGDDTSIWAIMNGFRNTRSWGKFDKSIKPAQDLALETLKGFDMLQGKLTNIEIIPRKKFETERILYKLEYMGLGIWVKPLKTDILSEFCRPPT